MLFYYKGVDSVGCNISGSIDAIDLESAKAKLKSQDIIFSTIKQKSTFNIFSTSKELTDKELAGFLQDLALYLKSGITVASALRLCKTQYEDNKKFSIFLNSIYQMIIEGSSFFTALKKQTILNIPQYVTQTIKVAEERGFLFEACYELVSFLKKRDEMASNAKKAIAYPAFIVSVSMLLIGLMLTVVVPTMADIFENNHQSLPAITKVVLWVSNFLSEYKNILLLLLLIVLVGFWYGMKNNYSFRYKVHTLVLKMPLIGRIAQTSQLARFLYVSAMLNRSGTPLAQAIRLAADTIDNEVLKTVLLNASNKVVQGARLSASIAKEPILDKAFSQALFLGEESGQTIDAILALSQKYQEENKYKTDIALSLLEPILMVFVGIVVGVIVAAMLLPIVNISVG